MASTKKCPDCAETVQADARKCRFCGYEFSQASAQKANRATDPAAGGCGLLIFIILIILVIGKCGSSGDGPDSNTSVESGTAKGVATEPYEVRLRREVESLRKRPRLLDPPSDKAGVLMEAVLIGARMKLYEEAPAKPTAAEEKLRAEFRRLQSAYQRDAFPKLRKAQAAVLDGLLWENDVDVAATGGRNENLRFTGGIFASNRGIKVAQDAIGDTLEILRFKRVMYEWYRGSEYQYYDYKPLPDGELATFVDNRWVPITGRQ